MKASKKLIWISILSFVVFILLLIKISFSNFSLDQILNSLMSTIQINFLINFSEFISVLFDTVSMIIISIIIAVIFLWKHYKKESLLFIFIILASALVSLILKNLIERPRPINALVTETSYAFPSGHSVTAVVFFGFLIYSAFKKSKSNALKMFTAIASVFMILLIGFTRLYLNVHWLSDIIAGLAIGLFILTLGIILKEKNYASN